MTHQAPSGALSQNPFIQSSVPSGQASPAYGPDGSQTFASSTVTRASPLENLYPDNDREPVFQQPGPVASAQPSADSVLLPARDFIPPDQIEE